MLSLLKIKKISIPAIIALLPLVYVGLLSMFLSVDLPFWDAWDLIPLLDKFYSGSFHLLELLQMHNGHSLVIPNLLLLSLAVLSHWDTRLETLLLMFIVIGIFLVLLSFFRRTFTLPQLPASASWMPAVASLLVFSLSQFEIWLWGNALATALNVLCVAGGIFFITTPTPGWGSLSIAILLGIFASFSFGNGLLFWPIGLLLLIGTLLSRPIARSRMLWQVAVFAMASIGTISAYIADYRAGGSASQPIALGPIDKIGPFVLTFLGGPVIGYIGRIPKVLHHFPSILFAAIPCIGLLGILVLVLGCWRLVAAKLISPVELFPYLGLAGYALGSAVLISLLRAGLGVEHANTSHYVTITNLFWVTVMVILVLIEMRDSQRQIRYMARGLIIFFVVLVACWEIIGLYPMMYQHHKLLTAQTIMRQRSLRPQETLWIHPSVDYMNAELIILKRHHLSLFRQ